MNYDLAGGLNQEKYAEEFIDPQDDTHRINRRKDGIFRAIRRHARPPARLLEIGCGSGRLLWLAKQAGFDAEGLELSPFLADSVCGRTGIPVHVADFLRFEPPPDQRFDVVVLQHVLEHLTDPILAMMRIRGLLRPGGIGVLEFPNIDGLDLRFKRLLRRTGLHRKSYPAGYRPGHCNEYNRRSFGALAAKTGFRLEEWRVYSWDPVTDAIYRWLPLGNKARAIVRRTD